MSFSGPGSRQLAIFFRGLAAMMNSGVHLMRALEVMSEQSEAPELAEAVAGLAVRVASGTRLSAAMHSYPNCFSRLEVQLVAVGEQTGGLHHILERLAERSEKAEEVRHQLRSALAYPVFIFGLCLLGLLLAPSLVFGDFLRILSELDAELPATTRLLVTLSSLLKSPLAILLLAAAAGAAYALFRVLRDVPDLRLKTEQLLLDTPVLGEALRTGLTAEFARALAACYAAGMPLLKAFELSRRVTWSRLFEERLAASVGQLQDGWTVHRTLTQTGLFGPLALGLLAAGEEVGQLQDALQKTAESCEQALEHTLKAATAALQPLMLLVIGLLVGFMVVSTLSPLLKVVQSL